ncbi:MAG TPA: ABC transporter permease subunit, partial [Bradyrhizobium sp.]
MTAVVLILAFAAFILVSFARGQIDWQTSGEYLFWPTIMAGLVNTIWLSVASMAVGIVLGVLCAVARGSPNPVLRGVAMFYAWFFRGTPVILQLLIWFNLALVFPKIGIPGLWQERTVFIITPVFAALVGLGLNEGAYISELVRSGLLAVDRGQYEAAKSIGMSYGQALRR